MQDIGAHSRTSDALPILVVGTTWLGWVPRSSCKPFNPAVGDAAMLAAWLLMDRSQQQQRHHTSHPAGFMTSAEQPLLACIRGLKMAAEVHSSVGGGGVQYVTRPWVQAAAISHTASRLLELEGQLCLASLSSASHYVWGSWRKVVAGCDNPQQLSAQVGGKMGGGIC